MNIYLDYLIKNFGGAHMLGAQIIGELIDNYDITNVFKSYEEYAKDHNMKAHNVERAVRHYIHSINTTEELEEKLQCKCFNGANFSNKEFLATIKLRAEEGNNGKK